MAIIKTRRIRDALAMFMGFVVFTIIGIGFLPMMIVHSSAPWVLDHAVEAATAIAAALCFLPAADGYFQKNRAEPIKS